MPSKKNKKPKKSEDGNLEKLNSSGNITNYKYKGKLINGISTLPGVYWFIDGDTKEFLYAGQATNLQRRISQHYDPNGNGKYHQLSKHKNLVRRMKVITNASQDTLNIEETTLINKFRPIYNEQEKAFRTVNTNIAKLTTWNGKGVVKKIDSINDLSGYVIGITGQFGSYSRIKIIKFLQEQHIDIKEKRVSKHTNLWLVGDSKTVGSKKLSMIDDDDFVVTSTNLINVLRKSKGF